jgi:isopenicillin-N epimerase
MPHVTLVTPRSPDMSAGIVSFDVAGLGAADAVGRLREWRVLGSVAPYARPHVRLTPSIRNSSQDVDFALSAVRALG